VVSDTSQRFARVALAALGILGSALLILGFYHLLERALSDSTIPAVLIGMLLLTLISTLAPRRR
jgi:hypothetical protein